MSKIYSGKTCEIARMYILLQHSLRGCPAPAGAVCGPNPFMYRQKQIDTDYIYMKQQKGLTLKTLTKSNVWAVMENDIFRMLAAAEKDAEFKDNPNHFITIIKCAFEVEEVKVDRPEVIAKYEARGFKVGSVKINDDKTVKWAIKKRPIQRVTDLTYENIRHISAAKLLEVIDRNFGGGWESLSQSIQDIIESGFEISTTTLPKDRLHKSGGMYEKKVNDGFEVLEIAKGTWVEAIFAKEKPEMQKLKDALDEEKTGQEHRHGDGDEDDDLPEMDDAFDDNDDDDAFDDDKLTEESYRTTFDSDPDELNLEAEDVSDDDDY